MTIRHINIFLAVCEAGQNTTKAAELLHMSQPAVSLAIHELEEYYGVALFDRIGRRLCITEAGKRFWEYASHISSMFDDMEKTLRDWQHLGVLRVGASITVGSRFLPAYVKTFLALHPGLEIRAQIASTEVLTGKIMANDLDFALVEGVPRHPSLVSEDYMEDHLAVICPAGGPFRQGETITVEQFRAQRFLLREKGSGTREAFDRGLAQWLARPAWIIDGDYSRTLPQRLEACDTVFFLDYPLEACLAGVENRRNSLRPDMPWVETELNAEFLREGTALRDFFQPDRVVIGSSSTRASSLLVELYAPLNAPLLLTDINSAELIKHSANAFLALKISFINAVARVCELAGADIKKVAAGVGLDHRIGLESMEAGIGYGGMCLPKDVAAYIRLAKGLGYDFQLLEAVQEVNNQQRQWPVRLLESQVTPLEGAKVALWGLSFKPHTDDLRSAPALEIIESLLARGVKVSCYDPAAMPKAALLYPQVEMAADPYAACQGAQALIICTEWPQFKSVDLERLAQLLERPLIIDGRNIFEPQRLAALNFQYFSVGRAPAAPIAQATTDRDR